jgi:DNA-binding Lrp family transcriptional regulator
VEDKQVDNAARIINSHPGVSHNYLRDHSYNIWFTLAAEDEDKLTRTIEYLAKKVSAREHCILRNEKLYKIGLMLGIGNNKGEAGGAKPNTGQGEGGARKLTDEEKEAVRGLQCDLPLEKNPFKLLMELTTSPLTLDQFLSYGESLKSEGIMRRYSAVLRHQKAGYKANAMTVWKPINSEAADKAAGIFNEEPSISHLYLRTVLPGKWEYPLFSMIHGKDEKELESIIKRLSKVSGITDYMVLRSLKEFKKERVTYFSPEFNNWETKEGL